MSDFVRNGDVKEILKIGRKANAFKITYFDVKGKLAIPIQKDKITEKSLTKYNLRHLETGEIGAMAISIGFLIAEDALEHALIILNREGISKNFDDYIRFLMIKRAPDEIKKFPDIPFDLSKDIKTKIRWILLGKQEQLTFKLTGKDILYKDQLYRIAPPKDGGLDEDE
jgi:hypothetical protein